MSIHNLNKITVGMVCVDLEGSRVLVDRIVDHKYAEVADWCGNDWSYDGGRVRMDELVQVAA